MSGQFNTMHLRKKYWEESVASHCATLAPVHNLNLIVKKYLMNPS